MCFNFLQFLLTYYKILTFTTEIKIIVCCHEAIENRYSRISIFNITCLIKTCLKKTMVRVLVKLSITCTHSQIKYVI